MIYRVLHIVNRFNIGGISIVVAELCKNLSDNFDIQIIGGRHTKSEKDSSVLFKNYNLKYKILKSMSRDISLFNDIKSLINILIFIYTFNPKIVHTHASKAGFLGRIACSLLFFRKIKVVHTYHGNVFDSYFSNTKKNIIIKIEQFLALRTHKIICLSNSQREDIARKYKVCDVSKIEVIPIGFNLNSFMLSSKSDKIKYKEFLGINKDIIVVTCVGRLVKIKNHKLFLDIIYLLKKRSKKRVIAIVVGDGSEKNYLLDYAKKLNLFVKDKCTKDEYDVIFTSWRNDLPLIYSSSDFVLLTSLNEGTPVSIIEAMASSRVVLSTNVGGVADLIPKGTGFIKSFNPNDFVDEILFLIENKEIMDEIGQNAQKHAIKNYSYNVMLTKTRDLYINLGH